MTDIIVIAILVILVVFAIRYIYKSKKKGKCAGCSHACSCHKKDCEEKNEPLQ